MLLSGSRYLLLLSIYMTACSTSVQTEHKDSQCYYASYGGKVAKTSVEKEIQYNRCLRENKPYLR